MKLLVCLLSAQTGCHPWMDLQRRGFTLMPACPGVRLSPLGSDVPRQQPLFFCYDPHSGNEMEIGPLSEVLW